MEASFCNEEVNQDKGHPLSTSAREWIMLEDFKKQNLLSLVLNIPLFCSWIEKSCNYRNYLDHTVGSMLDWSDSHHVSAIGVRCCPCNRCSVTGWAVNHGFLQLLPNHHYWLQLMDWPSNLYHVKYRVISFDPLCYISPQNIFLTQDSKDSMFDFMLIKP